MRRSQTIAVLVALAVVTLAGWRLLGTSEPRFIKHVGVIETGGGERIDRLRLYFHFPALRLADLGDRVSFVGDEADHVHVGSPRTETFSILPLRYVDVSIGFDPGITATLTGIRLSIDGSERVLPLGSITVIGSETAPSSALGWSWSWGVSSGAIESSRGTALIHAGATVVGITPLPAELGSVTVDRPEPTGSEAMWTAHIQLTSAKANEGVATCLIYRPAITEDRNGERQRLVGPFLESVSWSGSPAIPWADHVSVSVRDLDHVRVASWYGLASLVLVLATYAVSQLAAASPRLRRVLAVVGSAVVAVVGLAGSFVLERSASVPGADLAGLFIILIVLVAACIVAVRRLTTTLTHHPEA